MDTQTRLFVDTYCHSGPSDEILLFNNEMEFWFELGKIYKPDEGYGISGVKSQDFEQIYVTSMLQI